MSDNLNVTPGTGKTIGMDEVVDGVLGTVSVGFGKIMDGTLDSTNKLAVTTRNALLAEHVLDTSPATQNITAQDTASTNTTVANGQVVRTGTPTTGSVANFVIGAVAWETAFVEVTGTWTGSLIVEGSTNAANYYSKSVKQIGTGYTANNFTGNFAGEVNISTLTNLNVRSTAAFTGTAVVRVVFSLNTHSTYIANNLTLKDGTVQSITNTIKPASTAPLATDTAIVTTLRDVAAISATSLPLPTGAATSANQSTEITSLASIATNTSGLATTANQTNGNQLSKITNGTQVADTVAGETGYNGIVTNSGSKIISFSTTGTGAQTVGPFDMRGYSWMTIQYSSTGTGFAVQAQVASTIGGTYANYQNFTNAAAAGSVLAALGTSIASVYVAPIANDFLQLAISAITAGTQAGTITLSNRAGVTPAVSAGQGGSWTFASSSATGSATPTTANFIGVQARTSAAAAATNGNLTALIADVVGNLQVSSGGLVATPIAAATVANTVIKATPGRLCNVLVTATGAGSVSIFDNATTNTGTIIGALPASPTVGSLYQFGIPAANGITVAGGSTNPGLTISFV